MKKQSSSNKLKPALRFPQFTDSWEQRKLGDICERVMRKNKNGDSDLPLTISSQDGLIDQRNFFGKVVAAKDMSNYYLLENGEFAYNKSYSKGYDYGSIKRLNAYEMGCLSTLYICFALSDPSVDTDYLEHYFDTLLWYKDIAQICAEGARNHGLLNVDTKAFFESTNISVPKSLEEQRKIATFLDTLDTTIALHQRKLDVFKKYKRGLVQKIFSCDSSTYEKVALRDLTKQITARPAPKNEYPVYSVNNKNGFVPQSIQFEDRKIASDNIEKYKIVSTGQFGYNPSRINVGSINYLKDNIDVVVSPLYVVFECADELDKDYLYNFTKSREFKKQRILNTEGSVRDSLSYDGFSNILIPLPSINEQRKKVSVLNGLDNLIFIEEKAIKNIQKFKSALLQQMFI